MFGKLKDKLKSLLGKTESPQDNGKEKPSEVPKEKPAEALKLSSTKVTAKKPTTKPTPKSDTQKKSDSDNNQQITSPKAKTIPKDKTPSQKLASNLEKEKTPLPTNKKVPQKFETGKLKVELDLDSLPSEEKPIQQPSSDNEDAKPSFFSKLKTKLTTSVVSQEQVDEFLEPLELILLENNVALEVVDKIRENLKEDLVGISVKKGEIGNTISESLKNSISEVLQNPPNLIEEIKKHSPPYTIIFFGINGTGKTTSIAKLCHLLKSQGISVALAAADTFRAAAIEQLETHAKRLKVPIIKSQYDADPTSVAFDAVKYAEKNKIQCLLIDTAGRMYTKENLIKQMEKIIRVIKPNKKFFVGESIAGNDATTQAREFNEAVGIDGIILSKADVDEKGGTALSVSQITGKPIYFLGTGQDYKDLTPFNKTEILKNIGLE
tara:strand:+ start:774 stop:2081 length:1308 start_codon:yes stop_codon:yes gene_type:complete